MVLQSDQEPAIRALLRRTAALLGMSVKHSPVYSSRSQESVEGWHSTLWTTCKTLKTAIKAAYQVEADTTSPLMT